VNPDLFVELMRDNNGEPPEGWEIADFVEWEDCDVGPHERQRTVYYNGPFNAEGTTFIEVYEVRKPLEDGSFKYERPFAYLVEPYEEEITVTNFRPV
jgi:hypothetical protein